MTKENIETVHYLGTCSQVRIFLPSNCKGTAPETALLPNFSRSHDFAFVRSQGWGWGVNFIDILFWRIPNINIYSFMKLKTFFHLFYKIFQTEDSPILGFLKCLSSFILSRIMIKKKTLKSSFSFRRLREYFLYSFS